MQLTLRAKWSINYSVDFNYSGSVQSWSAPYNGYYKIETYGAQGGYRVSSDNGGKGAKAEGIFALTTTNTLYIVIGGDGKNHNGYNGGGYNEKESETRTGCSGTQTASRTYGGGATHIGKKTGLLSNFSTDYSNKLLIVAGGGGSEGISVNNRIGTAYSIGGNAGQVGNAGALMERSYSGFYASCGGGGGATQSSPGLGGTGGGTSGSSDSVGSVGFGGNGGGGFYGGGGGIAGRTCYDYSTTGRGSFGVGGAGNSHSNGCNTGSAAAGGGGGGSSYVNTSLGSSATYSSGVRTGDGYAKISYLGASI